MIAIWFIFVEIKGRFGRTHKKVTASNTHAQVELSKRWTLSLMETYTFILRKTLKSFTVLEKNHPVQIPRKARK